MPKKKILVIGAGPGGASSAYFLKHFDTDNQISVEIAERLSEEKYNTYHEMCGEGISEDLFKDIKPIKPSGIASSIHKIEEHWPGNIIISSKMDGYIINRPKFLQSIIESYKNYGADQSISYARLLNAAVKEGDLKTADSIVEWLMKHIPLGGVPEMLPTGIRAVQLWPCGEVLIAIHNYLRS